MGIVVIAARAARALLVAAGVGTAAAVAGVELACWAVARHAGPPPPLAGRGAVVVLGLPGSNRALRAAQRWRVELALAAQRDYRCDRVVFTGGPMVGERSEAVELAGLARRAGLDPALIVLEERARTTVENVRFCAPLVAGYDFVVLASDVLHADRARRAWPRPDDAGRDDAGGDDTGAYGTGRDGTGRDGSGAYGARGEGFEAAEAAGRPRLLLADRYRPLDRVWLRTPATLSELLYRAQARSGGPRPPATEVGWSRFLYEPGPVARRTLMRWLRRS